MDIRRVILSGNTAVSLLRSIYEPGSQGICSAWASSLGISAVEDKGLVCPRILRDESSPYTTISSTRTIKEILRGAPFPQDILGSKPELLFSDARKRPRQEGLSTRVWSTSLPQDSFLRLGPNIGSCSPEFVFVLRASSLGAIRSIAYGNEHCGRFSLDDSPRGMNDHPPFTSCSSIRAFVSQCARGRGRGPAAIAAKWIQPGFRSPMESSLYLLIILPRTYGGYAIHHLPEINARVAIPQHLRFMSVVPSYEVDLLWRKEMIAMEYDGGNHDDPAQRVRDDTKTQVLQQMGFQVFRITWDILNDVREFDCRVRLLGERLDEPIPYSSQDFSKARRRLRETLLYTQG